jgi:putative heme iron utilization protein
MVSRRQTRTRRPGGIGLNRRQSYSAAACRTTALDPRAPARLSAAMSETEERRETARSARRMLRRCSRAALATNLLGAPYVSLVRCAVDHDASPLLLLSDLAQHSRNIAFDPRVSLLFDDTALFPDPLSGPRLTVLGRAQSTADPRLAARFAAHCPESRAYAGFADFRMYRVAIDRGHLVAGFGRIAWIDGGELLFSGDCAAIAAAEPAILARLGQELREPLARCVAAHLGDGGAGWRAAGCDPEGLDLRRGETAARLEFSSPISTPEALPEALAQLAGCRDE